jgi:hypothetical protein
MGAALQVLAMLAFLVAVAFAAELAWHWLRWRQLRNGVDIGTMPGSVGRFYGFRPRGAAAGFGLALVAAAVALGVANPTVGGYVLFGIGLVTGIILMTAYYAWRLRAIARWWGR